MKHPSILFDVVLGNKGDLGIISLNRPEALNSLNHHMIHEMYSQLEKWANAENIKAVIIRAAEGRAFCAGGDLRHMYERFRSLDPKLAKFFHDEYQLNRFIFHFPKPYIALLDGITMGGGVGISIHGSHRVGTENLLFAMPETGIGFFPDVGGTYFLPRLSEHMGFYLGLTGARIKVDDCATLGIVTHKIKRDNLSILIQTLADEQFEKDAKQTVTHIINRFKNEIEPTPLFQYQTIINNCFAGNTTEEILHRLATEASEFSQRTIQELNKKSPTSLKITLLALQIGCTLDFDACMRQEFRLVSHFLQGQDFIEGVRALIIDKDQTPKWQPATLAEVSMEDVESYFAPVEEELI